MARAIWSGVLSFGLVTIPVELYSATEPHRPAFHQFEEGTADRIRYERVNERTGEEVGYADIVKGADIGGGNYVMLDQDEPDSVAPGRSRSLDIHSFVGLDEIDAIYFDKTYFLGPGGEEAAKPYALLRDARGPRPRAEIDNLPAGVRLSRQEVRMARQLVDSMSGPWTPSDYRDTYTDRVNDLIEAKKNDKEFQPAAEPPAATNVSDLARRPGSSTASQRHSPQAAASGLGSRVRSL
jgi:DNA end-binding protein Ku